jgi:PAS domain S-box-containing protein
MKDENSVSRKRRSKLETQGKGSEKRTTDRQAAGPGHRKGDLPTDSIDVEAIFSKNFSETGSFNLGQEILSTTFGKFFEALPIPAFIVDDTCRVMQVNQACSKISAAYRQILGADFSTLFSNPSEAKKVQENLSKVLTKRKPATSEAVMGIETTKIWARMTFRSVRLHHERFMLVLIEDLTREQHQLRVNEKLRKELERRVAERTSELAEANERLRQEIQERAEVAQALISEKRRFQNLVENAPFGLGMISSQGGTLYINPQFTEMFGYNLEDVPDLHSWLHRAYPDPDYRAQVVSIWLDDIKDSQSGKPVPRVLDVTCKDGSTKAVQFIPLRLPNGEQLVTCEDITERKRAEENLRKSEERYRTLFEYSRDAINIVTRDGVIVDANQAFCDLFGYTRTEIRHVNALHFWADPAERGPWQEELERQGFVIDYQWQAIRKDGSVRDCLLTSALRIIEGGGIQYQGISRDVTEQMQALKALKDSEERLRQALNEYRILYEESKRGQELYRSLLDSSPNAVVVYDLAGRVQFVNNSFTNIFGWKLEEVRGKRIDYVPESERETTDSLILKVLNNESPCRGFETKRRTKDGSILDISFSAGRYHDHEGKPLGLLVVGSDITERIRLEEQIRHAAKMEAIGRLAGGVAHDFNNLLTAIMGYTDILMRDASTNGLRQDKLSQISLAAQRAAGLTRQLLAFSRKQVMDLSVMDLNSAIAQVGDMLRRLIGEDVRLNTVLDPDLGLVRADPGLIEQVLMNLAVNARDAMSEGGDLTIETGNILLGEDYIRTHADAGIQVGDYVMFTVSDTGVGMDADTRSRIFDPFFTTKGNEAGTGLGLSTVYGIVKQHGGHVAVYSEPGHGTAFKIYLPRVQGEVDGSSHAAASGPVPRGRETVMVVEDEEALRDLACEVLEMLGYQVMKASSPERALAISADHDGPIHLLLTDVVLPQMDGRTLFETLAQSRSETKVLYVSGYTENFIVHHGVLDPQIDFLPKPFTVEALAHKIRDVLDRVKGSRG